MSRLARIREQMSVGEPAEASPDVHPGKQRGDALSDAAFMAKRSADALIEQEQDRARIVAGVAGAGGLLALLLGFAAVGGFGPPRLLEILSGAAMLVPTVYAFARSAGGPSRALDASFERGFCQVLAQQAKRLGDAVGSTDQRNVPLGPEAIIAAQLDTLYKDLERSNQRLEAAGARTKTAANRLHERIVPTHADTYLTGSDGRRYPVRIVDVSQSGVALRGVVPPLFPGEHVQAGGRQSRVVKVGTGEIALQFITPILPSEFNTRIIL